MSARLRPHRPTPSRGSNSRLVVFDTMHLNERGTDVAMWDYAHYNEIILGNRSWIACPADADIQSLDRFRERFTVLLYRDFDELQQLIAPADLYYRQVHGRAEWSGTMVRPPNGRTAIHCVFEAGEPHGDVYASISAWVSERYSPPGHHVPVVPYIAAPNEGDGTTLRGVLGIPETAIVMGRHGGATTFNIPFVHQVLPAILRHRPDLWIVLWNTAPFCPPHQRIIHLDANSDPDFRTRFLDTCDAMLHARAEGETFGLAVAEFSMRNLPVLTYGGSTDRHHLEVLGDRALRYDSAEQLANLLLHWQKRTDHGLEVETRHWDAYTERYSPDVVMRQFEQVFLSAAPAQPPAQRPARSPAERIQA